MCVSRASARSVRASSVGIGGRSAAGRRRGAVASSFRRGRRPRGDDRGDQELAECEYRQARARRSATSVAQRERRTAASQVVEHDLTALAVEVDGAPGRQKREVRVDLVDEPAAAGVEDRAQPIFEAELATVLADQVDDREVALAGSAAQAASELLGEYRR